MVNVSLPDVMKKQLDAIVKSGHFTSKSDVLKEAFRLMFEYKPNLKIAVAVELNNEKLSLSEIAEITEIKADELKRIFKERGIELRE